MSVVRQRRRICIVNREVGSEDPEPDLKMSQPDEAAFESMSIIVQLKRPTRLQYLPSTDTSFVTFSYYAKHNGYYAPAYMCPSGDISVVI